VTLLARRVGERCFKGANGPAMELVAPVRQSGMCRVVDENRGEFDGDKVLLRVRRQTARDLNRSGRVSSGDHRVPPGITDGTWALAARDEWCRYERGEPHAQYVTAARNETTRGS